MRVQSIVSELLGVHHQSQWQKSQDQFVEVVPTDRKVERVQTHPVWHSAIKRQSVAMFGHLPNQDRLHPNPVRVSHQNNRHHL